MQKGKENKNKYEKEMNEVKWKPTRQRLKDPKESQIQPMGRMTHCWTHGSVWPNPIPFQLKASFS